MTHILYSESRLLIAPAVVKSKPHLARILGDDILATVQAALVIAANDAVTGDADFGAEPHGEDDSIRPLQSLWPA